jgi:DNA-directed RNA polymerase subunit RPC12/RpoP
MKVIGYTYTADYHCSNCTRELFAGVDRDRDENGVSHQAKDIEGNLVNPIFSTDEQIEPFYCGDCGGKIE